jgi:outer membrane protein assembly factor BamB
VPQHYNRTRYLENIGLSSGSGSPTPVPTTPAPPPPTPPNDFSQARAPYLKTGPIPQGVTVNANNVASYPTGATQINSSPVYDPSLKLAFIGTNGSGVVAVDVNNFGTPVQRWRFNPANQKFIGPLVLYNGVIYVGGNDGLVYALRESDGAVVWSSSVASGLTGGVYTQVALDTDSLYTTAGDGLLHALNLSNGIQRWQVTGPGGVTLTNGPVIGADGTIYVTASDNRVYAYKKDGSQVSSGIWNPVALDGTIFATPALASGRLFVGTANGTLYALNSNGTIQTNKTFTAGKAIFGTPAVVNINGTLRVYVGTRDGNVYGVDADNLNNVRWTFPVGAEVNSSVAVVDNFVYVAADNKNLYRVEATNASNSLVLATADDIFDTNSPVVNSGYAIIAARNGGKLLIVR